MNRHVSKIRMQPALMVGQVESRRLALLPVAALIVTGAMAKSEADPVSLAGSWSGGGWVSFASGNKEKARCHAHYSRAGSSACTLQATCA